MTGSMACTWLSTSSPAPGPLALLLFEYVTQRTCISLNSTKPRPNRAMRKIGHYLYWAPTGEVAERLKAPAC